MSKKEYVKDHMTKKVLTFHPDTSMIEAAETLIKQGKSMAPVVDEYQHIKGILSEWDCLSVILKDELDDYPSGKVADYMSTEVITVSPEIGLFEVTELFIKKRYHRIPVIQNEKLVGIITRRDVLSAIKNL